MKSKIVTFMIVGLIHNFTQAQELDVVEAKYRGKPIIQMMLNGQKTWVLLDTGSDFTVLDTKVKDKYEFHILSSNDASLKVPGFGSTGNQLAPASHVKLEFGEVRLRGPVFAFDLSAVAKSIQRRTGKRIAGIIGTRMMSTYGFVIDMRSGTASIEVKRKKKDRKREYDQESLVVTTTFNRSN
ncbi:MAG: retropepsin-like aspartic protease [Reichenbachiella sp.]|uniref:retropepsin-like aspartic protease n=1 Tax=Reichenbachiella sp. TaxID=2184521 RepID=UPI00326356E2